MKPVNWLIALAFVVISACVIYLMRTGISLRSAPLIRPSVMDESMNEVGKAVFLRLFGEFQSRDLLVIGTEALSPATQRFIVELKGQAETHFKVPVKVYSDEELLEAAPTIAACKKTCWIQTEARSTSDIAPMPSVLDLAGLGDANRFTITVFEFDSYDKSVIPDCEKQKRLTMNCLRNLAIKEAGRRMDDPSKKYFFLKQYNKRDYFLFLQK